MNAEFLEDETTLGFQDACETCGGVNFYNEAGHYYCSLCNTQSQSARVYVDEDFVPERRLQVRATVLRGDKEEKSTKKSGKQTKQVLTTWEIWNVILKEMGDSLVEIGFPEIVKNKILHLYAAFMIRRKVIFVSKCNTAAKSAVTLGEPKGNVLSLYGRNSLPTYSYQGRKRKLKKKSESEEEPDDGTDKGTVLNSGELISRAQKKRRATRRKRQAMEQDYLATESARKAQEDAAFEKALNAEPSTSGSRADAEASSSNVETQSTEQIHFRYTKAARLLKSTFLKGLNFKRAIATSYSKRRRKLKREREYKIARNWLKFERFSVKTCLILVFVALRQLGFPIVISDLFRLVQAEIFDFQNVSAIIKQYEAYKDTRANRLVYSLANLNISIVSEDIDEFIRYMGLKRFCRPTMKEIVPKYIDDFVLPREFECLQNLLNHMYRFEDLLILGKSYGFKSLHYVRYAPEVLVVAQIVVLLKMLFGMDDLTERYQSEFASLVNKVVKEEVERNKWKMDEWTECFVIQDWFAYLQRRKDLVKRELYARGVFMPNKPPNVNKLNELFNKFTLEEDEVPEDYKEVRETILECNDIFSNILKDRMPPSESGQTGVDSIPQMKPYVPLPLPYQSIVDQYLERYPLVCDPSFKPEMFKVDFVKSRLDFIWNPKKYTALLRACGYKVKVVHGNAVDNFPENLKEGTVLVFQPYRQFDEFVDGFRHNCSDSMKFLLSVCEDIFPSISPERPEWRDSVDGLFLPKVIQNFGEMYIEKVLRYQVPVLTRWDEDFMRQ